MMEDEHVEDMCVIPGEGGIHVSITFVISQGVNVGIAEQNHIPDIIASCFLQDLEEQFFLSNLEYNIHNMVEGLNDLWVPKGDLVTDVFCFNYFPFLWMA